MSLFSTYDASIVHFVLDYLDNDPHSIWKLYWKDNGVQMNYRIYRTKHMFDADLQDSETVLQIQVALPSYVNFRLATWSQIEQNGNMGYPAWQQITNIGQALMAWHNANGNDDYYWTHKSQFWSYMHYLFNKPTSREYDLYGLMNDPNKHLTPTHSSHSSRPILDFVHKTETIEDFFDELRATHARHDPKSMQAFELHPDLLKHQSSQRLDSGRMRARP